MDRRKIKDIVDYYGFEDVLLEDGLDSAFIGLTDDGVAVYDKHLCVTAMMDSQRWTEEEAWEFLEFNTFCAKVGDKSPIYINPASVVDCI